MEAIPLFQKAAELDPNNPERWDRLFYSHELVRNYPAANSALDRAIALNPNSWTFEYHRAQLYMFWKGDLAPMEHLRAPTGTAPASLYTAERMYAKMLLRKWDEAEKIIQDDPREIIINDDHVRVIPKAFFLAELYFARNDRARARHFFEAVLPFAERLVQERAADSDPAMTLAEVYAGLGRKEDAIREAERAAEIIPVSKSAWIGKGLQIGRARIYAMLGDADHAVPILAQMLTAPSDLHVHALRLEPEWDSLRADPRFQQLLKQYGADETMRTSH
jgi:tetratricopeptide (TPR) repeat protein